MNLNSTPLGERIQIGFFGKRNAGKSSLINAVTNQNISIVSDTKGTTTDPVQKTMEILPLGPVLIIDTPGFDDEGKLGDLRIEKTYQVLNKVDIAVLVVDSTIGLTKEDKSFINVANEKNITLIIVYNKCDLSQEQKPDSGNELYVSAEKNINIDKLKELIANTNVENPNKNFLVKDIVKQDDLIVLVTPIDSAAPKGRLILPQQQVLRDLLDLGAVSMVVKETELISALKYCSKKPKLVITDSQVFNIIKNKVPEDIFLTSFSILFARYKGILNIALNGIKAIKTLEENDTVLISEGCTHHRQCDDIGTVKLPRMLESYTKHNLKFEFSSGTSFPSDLSKYKMIIHCGSCMLKDKEVIYRYNYAAKQNIPITNYGMTIAYINGILKRSLEIFQLDLSGF